MTMTAVRVMVRDDGWVYGWVVVRVGQRVGGRVVMVMVVRGGGVAGDGRAGLPVGDGGWVMEMVIWVGVYDGWVVMMTV